MVKTIKKPSDSFKNQRAFTHVIDIMLGHKILAYVLWKIKRSGNTDDGKFTYVFDMVEKDDDDPKYSTAHGKMKFVFDAEHSSEMLWMSDIYDGCEFI